MGEDTIERVSFRVPDMMCDHCRMAISRALSGAPGVRGTTIDLRNKTVTIEFERGKATAGDLERAIADAGYTPEGT